MVICVVDNKGFSGLRQADIILWRETTYKYFPR